MPAIAIKAAIFGLKILDRETTEVTRHNRSVCRSVSIEEGVLVVRAPDMFKMGAIERSWSPLEVDLGLSVISRRESCVVTLNTNRI